MGTVGVLEQVADLAELDRPAERSDALVDVLDEARVLDGRDGARRDRQPRSGRAAEGSGGGMLGGHGAVITPLDGEWPVQRRETGGVAEQVQGFYHYHSDGL